MRLDNDGIVEAEELIRRANVRPPDFRIDPGIGRRDPGLESDYLEYGLGQLIERGRGQGQYLAGCYLFFDDGSRHRPVSFLYAGKAARVKNRIGAHLRGDGWLQEYWKRTWEDQFNGLLWVFVWLDGARSGFEAELIAKLKPVFNRQTPDAMFLREAQ